MNIWIGRMQSTRGPMNEVFDAFLDPRSSANGELIQHRGMNFVKDQGCWDGATEI